MRTRILFALAGIGGLVFGAILWLAPGDLATEIPPHRPIGAGFVLFGAFLLAIAVTYATPLGRRLRTLGGALGAAGFAVFLAAGIVPDAVAGWRLSQDGMPARAVVVGENRTVHHSRRTGTNMVRRAEIAYDGHRGEIEIGTPVGGELDVLYLAASPDVVRAGRPGDSFLTIAARGGSWFYIAAGLVLLFATFAIATALSALRRAPPPAS